MAVFLLPLFGALSDRCNARLGRRTSFILVGTVLAVTLITQLIKGRGLLDKLPTRLVAHVVALIVLLAANAITGTLDLPAAGLCVVNAVGCGVGGEWRVRCGGQGGKNEAGIAKRF